MTDKTERTPADKSKRPSAREAWEKLVSSERTPAQINERLARACGYEQRHRFADDGSGPWYIKPPVACEKCAKQFHFVPLTDRNDLAEVFKVLSERADWSAIVFRIEELLTDMIPYAMDPPNVMLIAFTHQTELVRALDAAMEEIEDAKAGLTAEKKA